MSQPQITVVDANKVNQTIFTTNPNGQATSANSQPVVIANDQTPLPIADGVDGTGITQPTGGIGIRGWLSGIYQKISSTLTVTGPVTNNELRATPLSVSGPLTDTQLRATAVSIVVNGEVEVKNDSRTPLNVTIVPSTLVDKSGTITSSNVSQVVAAANNSRKGFSIQNIHEDSIIWVNLSTTATAGGSSIKLVPGAYYETPIGGAGVAAISVISTVIGHPFSAKEW